MQNPSFGGRPGGHNMKRQRGRNNGRGGKPHIPVRSQLFDSSGPDVRIRGNAYQVLEKYLALARDATSVGDRVAAENFYQHAEHYYRLINESGGHQQNRPQQPQGGDPRAQGYGEQQPGPQPQFQDAQPFDPGAGPQPGSGPQPLVPPTDGQSNE